MYGKLTRQQDGSYDLPVSIISKPRPIVDYDGNQHPKEIWSSAWSDEDRFAIGLCKVSDVTVVAENHEKTSTVSQDVLNGMMVERTYTTVEKPIEPQKTMLKVRVDNLHNQKAYNSSITITLNDVEYTLQITEQVYTDVSGIGSAIANSMSMPFDSNGDPASSGGTHIKWTMADNTNVLFAQAEFLASLAAPVMSHRALCHFIKRYHKDAIEEIDNWDDLNNYDITTGWPVTVEQ